MQIDHFRRIYPNAVRDVLAALPADWSTISRHNPGWHPSCFDPQRYLAASQVRYEIALRHLEAAHVLPGEKLLDIGGFLAAFPLALQRLGYEVSIAEKLAYYDQTFLGIWQQLSSEGIQVWDEDLTQRKADLQPVYKAITCLAVAEHLPHSPRPLLQNAHDLLTGKGLLLFEVPNLAYWPKRLQFLKGQSVMAPIEHLYPVEGAFTGHHREYTLQDARYVLTQSGFTIEGESFYNFSLNLDWGTRLRFLPAFLFPNCREVMMFRARKP